jgi:hypothetical protein
MVAVTDEQIIAANTVISCRAEKRMTHSHVIVSDLEITFDVCEGVVIFMAEVVPDSVFGVLVCVYLNGGGASEGIGTTHT